MERVGRPLFFVFALLAPLAARAMATPADDQYAVAAGQYARGRWALAVDEFKTYLTAYADQPKANDARFFMAEALVQLGRLDQARSRFREFLRRAPEHRYRRQAQFRIGETAYLDDKYDEARSELQRFRQTYPDDPLGEFVLPYLGEIALHNGDKKQAAKWFREGLSKFPQGRLKDDCRFGLAKARSLETKPAEAEATFADLAKSGGELADDAQFQLGATYYGQQQFELAIEAFDALEKKFPRSPLRDKGRLGRAWALFHLKRYDQARDVLGSLLDSKPLGTEARYWLGLSYKALKDWPHAAEQLESVAKRKDHPLAVAARFHAGEARLRLGDYQQATKHFDAVLDEGKTPWAQHALLGKLRAAVSSGSAEDVERLAQRFTERFPESELAGEVGRLRARSLLEHKENAPAIEMLERVVASQGDRPPTLRDRYLLATAYERSGLHDKALKTLKPVLAGAEAESDLLQDAERLEGSVLVALKRYDEAVEPLRRYLIARPDSQAAAGCRAELAVCFARTGHLGKAKRAYEQFLKQHAASPLVGKATAQLADAAYAAKDNAWAAELYKSLTAEGRNEELVARGLSGLAWCRRQQGRLEEAAKTFAQLIDRYPHSTLSPEAALARGEVLEKLDRPDAALEMYHRVIEQYGDRPQVADAVLAAARLHDRLEQHAEAAALFDRFLDEFRDHPERDVAIYQRAWVASAMGDSSRADRLFEQLKREQPDSRYWPDATYRLAEHAFEGRDFKRSEQLLSELIQSKPGAELAQHALYLQGQLQAVQGNWDAAVAPFEQLLADHPSSALAPMAEYWLAEADYRRGRYDQAAERLDRLAQSTADDRENWVGMIALRRSQVRAHKKQWAEALEIASGIAKRFPNFNQQYEADYVIGRALAMQARFEDARQAYRRVTRSADGSSTETAAMAQWMIGETYFHQKDYRAAIREYLRLEVLYAYPKWQSAALLQAGKCYELLGQADQAQQLYARIMKEFAETSFANEAARRLRTARSPGNQRS